MKAEDIALCASKGTMPEDKMNCPEKCLFYALRDLYAEYKSNRITKAMAQNKKQELLKQYNDDLEEFTFTKKFLQYQARFWKEIEVAAMNYNGNKTIENADAFVEAVYGVGML